MKFCFIYDLDGVLVESLAFERAVSEQIIRALGRGRQIHPADAECLWLTTLQAHRDHPRWHDYGLHCSALGLADEWRAYHEQFKQLIRPMPNAMEALLVGGSAGSCWIASDATQWVVEFKLQAAGMDLAMFDEVFTLDRCLTNKGHRGFWTKVKESVPSEETHLVYIDNRHDRLASASEVLPTCSFVQVVAEDHPTSLGLFVRDGRPTNVCVFRVAISELPSLLESIVQTVQESS